MSHHSTRKFFGNAALLVSLNMAVKMVWILVIERGVQNEVGAAEYGNYFALFNFTLLFQALLDFGINNFNTRTIAAQPALFRSYFSNVLALKIILAIAYSIVMAVVSRWLGYQNDQLYLLFLLVQQQILLSMLLFARSNVAALQYFKADSILSVTDRTLMIILVGLLAAGVWLPLNITHFIYAQIIALLLAVLLGILLLRKQLGQIDFNMNIRLMSDIIKNSVPYALLALLMAAYTRSDAVLLERLVPEGVKEAGIYAAAYRLVEAGNQVAVLLSSLLLPWYAARLDMPFAIQRIAEWCAALLALALLPILAAGVWQGEAVMKLLYHDATAVYSSTLAILLPALLGMSLIYVYGTLLTAYHRLRLLNIIAAAAVLLNVGLNIWLLPLYRSEGAAMAASLTQLSVAALHIVFSYQVLQSAFPAKAFIKLLLYGLLCMALFYSTTFLNVAWWLQTVIAMSGCVFTALLLYKNKLKEKLPTF